jgi:hypothetical protein
MRRAAKCRASERPGPRFSRRHQPDYIIAGKYTKTLDFSCNATSSRRLVRLLEDDPPGDRSSRGALRCGSSREQHPDRIRVARDRGRLEKSYSRIFFRNA